MIVSADQDSSTGISTCATLKGAASARDVILGRLFTCIWRLTHAGLSPLAVVVYIILLVHEKRQSLGFFRASTYTLVVESEVGVGVDRVRDNAALQLGERNVVDEGCRGLANDTHDVWL